MQLASWIKEAIFGEIYELQNTAFQEANSLHIITILKP